MQADWIINNIHLATMSGEQAYGEVKNACLAVSEGKIIYAGKTKDCPCHSQQMIDGQGGWLTPGLIDCHTHLIYAGNRAVEFEQRLKGVSYAEIARNGGGIQRTVNATRAATHQQLFDLAVPRLQALMNEGVTTVEIKSGYGLNADSEIKMLEVAGQLADALPVNVRRTFLGAHTVPVEYKHNADAYVDLLCEQLLPQVAGQKLADAMDVFCESIGFSVAQCERLFARAKQLGLPVKAHVEQLSDLKGARLAARYQALSVDHLEYLQAEDITALAESGTVAVLLPGAFYFLQESQRPPIQALREQGVPMAVATDLNPGSSPMASLLSAMNMACVLFAITPEEALAGVTCHAASALGLASKGKLQAGMDADLCLWAIDHPSELAYGMQLQKPRQVWLAGEARC